MKPTMRTTTQLIAILLLAASPAAAQSATDAEPASDAVAVAESAGGQETAQPNPALLDPSLATETAPKKFRVLVETTSGDFTIEVNRSWAPN